MKLALSAVVLRSASTATGSECPTSTDQARREAASAIVHVTASGVAPADREWSPFEHVPC